MQVISGWVGVGQVVMDRWEAGLSHVKGKTEGHGRAEQGNEGLSRSEAKYPKGQVDGLRDQ